MSAHAPTDSYEGGEGPPLVLLHGIGGFLAYLAASDSDA